MNRHPLCLPLKHLVLAAACGLGAMAAAPAAAQVAPNATEVAAYKGLHSAAHRGDVAQIEKLAAAKSRMKLTQSSRCGLHRVADLLESADEAVCGLLGGGAVKIGGAPVQPHRAVSHPVPAGRG